MEKTQSLYMVELVDATTSIDSRLRVVGVMNADTWEDALKARMLAEDSGLSAFVWERVNPALYYNDGRRKP